MSKARLRVLTLVLVISMLFPNFLGFIVPITYAVEGAINNSEDEVVQNFEKVETKLNMITAENKMVDDSAKVNINDVVNFMLEYSISNISDAIVDFKLFKGFEIQEDNIFGAKLINTENIENNLKKYTLEIDKENVTGVITIVATLTSLGDAPGAGKTTPASFTVSVDGEEKSASNTIDIMFDYINTNFTTTNNVLYNDSYSSYVDVGEKVTYKAKIASSEVIANDLYNNFELVYTMPNVEGLEYVASYPDGAVWNSGERTVTWNLGNIDLNTEYTVEVKYNQEIVNAVKSRFDMKCTLNIEESKIVQANSSFDRGIRVYENLEITSWLYGNRTAYTDESTKYTITYTPKDGTVAQNGNLVVTLPAIEGVIIESVKLDDEEIYEESMLDNTTFPNKLTLPEITGTISKTKYEIVLKYTKLAKESRKIYFNFKFEGNNGIVKEIDNSASVYVYSRNEQEPEEVDFQIIESSSSTQYLAQASSSFATPTPNFWILNIVPINEGNYTFENINVDVQFPGINLANYSYDYYRYKSYGDKDGVIHYNIRY